MQKNMNTKWNCKLKYAGYDKYPCKKIDAKAYFGYGELRNLIKNYRGDTVIIDCYPEVDTQAVVKEISDLFDLIISSDDCALKGEKLEKFAEDDLTHDRIFGVMTRRRLEDFFIKSRVDRAKKKLLQKGKKLVIGVGAMLISQNGLKIYASMTRWEAQLRFRKGVPNWNCENYGEDCLTKFKRGYFCEWRIADRHKEDIFEKLDYFIDASGEQPVLFSASDYRKAIEKTVTEPFRVVPYFDPGVWGGQWMKQVCGLDPDVKNYAWCFDCVPEENSVMYDFKGVVANMPAIDLVLFGAEKLLGERVVARFGKEFPIRFDFLDTMDGGNLSLQVHPTVDYIQKTFNMNYTQDESYYILDCKEDGGVYLGLKTGVSKEEFGKALENAQNTGVLDVEKFVNKFHAKKHDHFLIPSGTVHCSASNCMVLEISSTPYIFTFKLWDWGRVGLDGKPRPINIKHGLNVIRESRNTEWVEKNLINRVQTVRKEEGYTEERTGLHEFEFIETRRHKFNDSVLHKSDGGVCVMNLAEGDEAVILPVNAQFEPFNVHYAETFIIPASVGDFIVAPTEKTKGKTLITVKACLR